MPTYLYPPETYAVMGTKQVASLIGVHQSTVTRWVVLGQLKATPDASGRNRVSRDDLINFLNARRMPMPTCLLAYQAEMYFSQKAMTRRR